MPLAAHDCLVPAKCVFIGSELITQRMPLAARILLPRPSCVLCSERVAQDQRRARSLFFVRAAWTMPLAA